MEEGRLVSPKGTGTEAITQMIQMRQECSLKIFPSLKRFKQTTRKRHLIIVTLEVKEHKEQDVSRSFSIHGPRSISFSSLFSFPKLGS